MSCATAASVRADTPQPRTPPRAVLTRRASQASATAAPEAGASPQTIYLKDYTPAPYAISTVRLDFQLGEDETLVTSTLQLARSPASASDAPASAALELAGSPELQLRSVTLNGAALPSSAYSRTPKGGLLLHGPLPDGAPFELQTVVAIRPQDNTALEGLYKSSGNFCTQCEAESVRALANAAASRLLHVCAHVCASAHRCMRSPTRLPRSSGASRFTWTGRT